MFTKLVVNEEEAAGAQIFRIDGWRTALIVSEGVKQTLEQGDCQGIRFESVT